MTRIDFYTNAEPKLTVACQVAAKAVSQSRRVLIRVPDPVQAKAIDRLMWTSPAIGFLPHCGADDSLAGETPVLIATDDACTAHDEVLINLGPEAPPLFTRFQRLIEIVGIDDAEIRAGRKRFRFYRDRGYELGHVDLAKPGG